jgi:hypothetical protein
VRCIAPKKFVSSVARATRASKPSRETAALFTRTSTGPTRSAKRARLFASATSRSSSSAPAPSTAASEAKCRRRAATCRARGARHAPGRARSPARCRGFAPVTTGDAPHGSAPLARGPALARATPGVGATGDARSDAVVSAGGLGVATRAAAALTRAATRTRALALRARAAALIAAGRRLIRAGLRDGAGAGVAARVSGALPRCVPAAIRRAAVAERLEDAEVLRTGNEH